ncbi:MAG: hypothetical protein ACLQBL_12910 [Polyangiaceae bacterium]
MRNFWRLMVVLALGGCATASNTQAGGVLGDGGSTDAETVQDAPANDDTGTVTPPPPPPDDGGKATVLDSSPVEWSNEAGFVNPSGSSSGGEGGSITP